ncbi:hypothetical protein MLD38_023202 [Melastoma candidum]|uniref:Uncharacterized protein n=1 Tax=Melastoma candidum TaxID=119954 RepID=A0ACB9QLQ2_9MYRT|nr:hypothetical protein MLD38_023202 [Melastoma candidum]
MRGFMCQSVEVTSGCLLPETRNVIVPRSVLHKNDDLSSRLINLEKARFGGRKEANASRRSRSLIVTPSGNKTSGQVHVGSSSDIKPCMVPSTVYSSNNAFQVVVMRVSLHCQGCAGKVKKHLSRMEGVTSFSIDLEEKRVTVRGHVSPAGVLESISKVKKAELWTSLS